jgi:hypothetical protein
MAAGQPDIAHRTAVLLEAFKAGKAFHPETSAW